MSKQKQLFELSKRVFKTTKITISYYYAIIKKALINRPKLLWDININEKKLLKLKILNLKVNNENKKIFEGENESFVEYNPNLITSQSRWVTCLNDLLEVNKNHNKEMDYLDDFLLNYEKITKRLIHYTGSSKYNNDLAVLKKLKKTLSDNYIIKDRRDYYALSIISAFNFLNTHKGKLFFIKIINEYINKVQELGINKKRQIIEIIDINRSDNKKIHEFKTPDYNNIFRNLNKEIEYIKF